jgi:prepilin-type N-terminal cleavage/methylation domain-containing protein
MHTITEFRKSEARFRRLCRGFTLAELLIATGLSAIVLAAVLSTALMTTKSGYLLNGYLDMEAQARHALEQFGQDARMADSVEWGKDADGKRLVQLILIDRAGGRTTYIYDSDKQQLIRDGEVLISGIQTFNFTAYAYGIDPGTGLPTFNDIVPAVTPVGQLQNETKMVQISLSAVRSRNTLADATNTVVSARFVLRNKDIT